MAKIALTKLVATTWIFLLSVSLMQAAFAKEYISPDKRFTVSITYGDEGGRYTIADKKTKQKGDLVPVTTRLLWLAWSSDSRTFVAVEHLAGGSIARIFNFCQGKWNVFDAHPPIDHLENFSVVKITLHDKIVSLVYKASKGDSLLKCSFDIMSDSFAISAVKTEAISEDEYDSLQEIGD